MSDYRTLKLALLADTSKFTTGMNNATKQTKTFGQRLDGVAKGITRGMDLAATAVAGLAVKLAVDGVKAAIEDEKAQVKLATTLKNTTKANAAQTKQVEKYIDKLQRATGVADDQLRPSLEKLLVATGKIGKAQKLQALAMDIAAGTGKDLNTVSLALAKAYNGNLGSLTRLGVKLDENIIKNKDFDAAQKELAKTFAGQSAAAAETMAGKMARFNVAIGEAKESIGVALLPTLEKMINYLNSPKGQKVITDFAKGFSEAMIALAKALPGILEGLKKIGATAGKLGINWDTFADPKLVAAAAAFRLAPGGAQAKIIAALVAYQGAGALGEMPGEGSGFGEWLNFAGEQARNLNPVNMPLNFIKDKVFGGGGDKPQFKMPSSRLTPTINITINGAVDSRESARIIQKTLNKINLNGGSLVGTQGFN